MIKLSFKSLTGHQLPKKADGIRALGNSGRARAVFVRFETDTEGMDYVLETFGGGRDGSAAMDSSELAELQHSSDSVFSGVAGWQDALGLSLYDQAALQSVYIFESELEGRRYKVLLDRQDHTVYMFADARYVIE